MKKNRYDRILEALNKLNPIHIQLIDDSHKHASHTQHLGDHATGGETHYNLILVSLEFNEMSRIERQRTVNKELDTEFKNGLHALQMKLFSPAEFNSKKLTS